MISFISKLKRIVFIGNYSYNCAFVSSMHSLKSDSYISLFIFKKNDLRKSGTENKQPVLNLLNKQSFNSG